MYTAESSLLSPAIGTAEQWIGVVAKRNPVDAEAVVRAYFACAPRVLRAWTACRCWCATCRTKRPLPWP